MDPALVYDVGMHNGEDTAAYLSQGFRVAAIEANPVLVEEAERRFAEPTAAGRLILVNAAVSDHEGVTGFYVCREPSDAWSTTEEDVARYREREFGARFEEIEVPALRFEQVLSEHGVPHYLKIDIEGADVLCLKALHEFEHRPHFVSLEIMREHAYEDLCHLIALGYSRFKLVKQHRNENPDSSGPFGDDAPGPWLEFRDVLRAYPEALAKGWYDLHAAR
jgi:FkbM family methyltransferase